MEGRLLFRGDFAPNVKKEQAQARCSRQGNANLNGAREGPIRIRPFITESQSKVVEFLMHDAINPSQCKYDENGAD
jgi:hypothetical protein